MSQLTEVLDQFNLLKPIDPGVVLLTGYDYPVLFFSLICLKLREQKIPINFLDVATLDIEQLQAQLSGTFLGLQQIFFLKNCYKLDAAKLETIKILCNAYQGPHKIFCFFLDDIIIELMDSKLNFIPIPKNIEHKDYLDLRVYLVSSKRQESQFSRSLFTYSKVISLEDACLMHFYQLTLGKSTPAFFSTWADKIVHSVTSLFTLSQNFFSKNANEFFALNKKYETIYSFEFWIGYWSQQLWQAGIFVEFALQKKLLEGKKHASRLPFSFTQKDWKRYQYEELARAHAFLCAVDSNMKRGGSEFGLHLFYLKFLSGHFK